MNISATEKGGVERSWSISLGENITATSADSSKFSLSREEVMKNLTILDGLMMRRTISFKKPVKKILYMDPQSFSAFANWLGYKAMLEIFLKTRFSWTVVIGVIFILTSLPLPGDAGSGLNPIPFNPLDFGMGFSLILIGIFSKRFPDRIYFLIDSGWFILLAIITFLNILKGNSIYWLIFVMLQISLVVSGVLTWHRLKAYEKQQTSHTKG